MENNQGRTVYILSGPAGVGKTTTSKELVKKLSACAYISGDDISHMHVIGRKNPWESEEETSLIWDNILSLTKNFLWYGNDVVVDYVTFPHQAIWLYDNLRNSNVRVVYVVLWADQDTLIERDSKRLREHRMGERCLLLADEFKKSGLDEKYLLSTTEGTKSENEYIIDEIISNAKFRIKGCELVETSNI
ncbi:AAA family ATPase [Sporosarcina limicola]|uniref:Gluconate kinase n=1 Tax=Sporosarcina limicola TaxID=34101 RepID=A0A927REV8_9BACL|nr:AAA family ATPase [Sporosarcina limicola]MBE1556695.1 gluconate kinase [Sporosarcina limicola]